ncbi:fumarylacetoacetate hydrolase family protein [Cupriavidus sp. AU9028]|uniref:fumarylacetoacetate hydrolase family protein n=1 Tax=Cupriavidus sp. AU9028 TaxID=2871157 RepID=UPI001C950D0E|nr:fumarylacetoacetate hydrolase family protein [Cupriavidus sp. AU9028]MBY4895983.1 fumarylacetoacetate hydrolase family protein [Cupriavidus sp. AU9028]
MKLLRYGPPGAERPGMLDAEGKLRDLSALVGEIEPRLLAPESLSALAAIDPGRLPEVGGQPRLGVPVSGIGKFIAVGLNYSDHAAEAGMPIPAEPILFSKAITCICGANDEVVLPAGSVKSDWEVELGVVIGRRAKNVPEADALAHVAGYCVVNDVSEREFQLERSGGQWDKGKGFDTFGPIGPWLVTADEVPDPQALEMWLEVNGERLQSGNTRTMIFGVAHLVSYISRCMTLMPGDVIATGTPPGVGMGCRPQRFLKPGDTMRLGIAGLGEQRQRVVAGTPG